MTVSQSDSEVLGYDLDHVIIFHLINTFCSVSDDSFLAVSISLLYYFSRAVLKVVLE